MGYYRKLKRIVKIKYIFTVLFFGSLISCSDDRQRRKDIVADKIEDINSNQREWNSLTERILKDEYVNSRLGYFINPKELNESLSIDLREKEVISLSVDKTRNCQEVEYTTSCTKYPIGTLYLKWTSCDSIQSQKGYYKDNFDINFIEVWGIGNNWLIWIDSDFI